MVNFARSYPGRYPSDENHMAKTIAKQRHIAVTQHSVGVNHLLLLQLCRNEACGVDKLGLKFQPA